MIDDVLICSQYACLLNQLNVRTIVDVGANIGTASVFLLNAYPEATVIALEPDPGNCELLRKNVSYYHPRIIPLRMALWDRPETLTIDRDRFGEWAFKVRPKGADDIAEVQGITLPDLMREQNLKTIDILKIDIEGAERNIFRESAYHGWRQLGTLQSNFMMTDVENCFLLQYLLSGDLLTDTAK